MRRRNFLKTTFSGAMALAAAGVPRIDFAQANLSGEAGKTADSSAPESF